MSGHRPMKAAHDPLFDSAARRAFMAALRPLRYDVLAGKLERLGLPRPSSASGMYRKLIRDTVATNPGDEITVAEIVRRLFQPRLHLLTAPPVDSDGYLDSLLDEAFAVCAAAEWRDITICDGVRVFWPVVSCRWPEMGEAGVCGVAL